MRDLGSRCRRFESCYLDQNQLFNKSEVILSGECGVVNGLFDSDVRLLEFI